MYGMSTTRDTDYIYLDNAATTRLDERVLEAMKPYFFETYAVATSEFAYSMGLEAREALENARARLAAKLGASAEEIVFTSDPTESSNLAIMGVVRALGSEKKPRLVTTAIEDFPVLNMFNALERSGYDVTFVPVDDDGIIDEDAYAAALKTQGPLLVSIQHANQEIGTVQDIGRLAAMAKERGAIVHTDATHTFTRVPLDVATTLVDLVTIASHTIHGPRGIAALYVRDGTPIKKILEGGYQERNLRPGTENIPGAVGFAAAADLVTEEENARLREMRDFLIDRFLAVVPDTVLNGHRTRRIPHNANITFRFVEGESLTLHLDFNRIAVSTGSACFSKSLEASHVILAIGGDHERAHGSLRFTLSRFNTIEQLEKVVEVTSDVVARLREISPLGKEGSA